MKKTNEIKKSDVFTNDGKDSFEFLNEFDLHFRNWIGKINNIETNKGGEKLYLTISSNLKGQKINYTTSNCLFDCGINKNNKVFGIGV